MAGPHKDWRVAVSEQPTLLIAEVINAHRIWGWLPKSGRKALLAAKENGAAVGHPLTLRSLRRHGLIGDDDRLTEAGALVAKWNPPPKATAEPDGPATNTKE